MTKLSPPIKRALALAVLLSCTGFVPATRADEEFTERRTGLKLPVHVDEMTLLGAGLRVRKFAFIPVRVYVVAVYVSDAALAGPLATHKGGLGSPAFYQDLVWGDFPKELRLRFLRDLSRHQIQDAMTEALAGADPDQLDRFVSYFDQVKEGQECLLRWAPGGTLLTTYAGHPKPPIPDKKFAAAVFAIYLGDKPLQDDIKKDLAARAPAVIR